MSMSKSKIDSDGFQIVTSKRFTKNKPTKVPPKNSNYETEVTVIDTKKSIGRIHSAVNDLRNSLYLKHVLDSLDAVFKTRQVVEIICFGLGHIGECSISRHQLALLLSLKDHFSPKKVLVHDPVFYKSECDILKQLDLVIIEENKEGSYIITDEGLTLVYLPHCPKQLTNNFLWSNWSIKLENCILLSNSFNSLVENQPNRILSETVPYLHKIFPYTDELVLENNFKYTDIFNDTSVHHFPKEKLEKLDSDFWQKGNKPEYTNTEEFITSLMIEKLNI